MRRFLPLALIALAAAAPLSASTTPKASEPRPEPESIDPPLAAPAAPAAAEEAPSVPELRLDRVQVEERAVADEADPAQWPQRGSFWWLVGVIVVAGVILAVLL